MEKKIDWSKAPEDATHAGSKVCPGVDCWYKDTGNGEYLFWYAKNGRLHDTGWQRVHGDVLHGPLIARPAAAPDIKTLEQRIIERAEQRLQGSVEEGMMRLRLLAGVEVSDQPSGINDMTVREAIDAVGAAIVRLKLQSATSEALERALEELADRLEPSNLLRPR